MKCTFYLFPAYFSTQFKQPLDIKRKPFSMSFSRSFAGCLRFAPLIQATTENGFTVNEVSADKAYSSRANYETIKQLGDTAYIPFLSHVSGKSRGSLVWRKMFLYFQLHQDEFIEHYNKRSNAESTFHAIKMKFGDTLKSKNPKAQENELLCKIIAHNIIVLIHESREFGVHADFSLSAG